jgi:hypothetical protein
MNLFWSCIHVAVKIFSEAGLEFDSKGIHVTLTNDFFLKSQLSGDGPQWHATNHSTT